jgi:hypothetical protein
MRISNNQNLLFVGGFSVGGKPVANRAFRRRRRSTISGMKQIGAKMRTPQCRISERPSGSANTPSIRNSEPSRDNVISIFDGFMRSNETELSYRWRERAFATSTMGFINSTWSSRRPAVGWSDLLDAWCGFIMCVRARPIVRPTASLAEGTQGYQTYNAKTKRGGDNRIATPPCRVVNE